jgi:hypothetical protein
MSEDEDPDLLALQRQLDDAFQTTRPRPAFEDELWLRMQARRPIWLRLREGLAGLIEGIREAPAVPSAAVAIALIVLLGAGILTMNGLHPGGGSTSLQAGTNRGNAGVAAPKSPTEFGALPRPAISQPQSPTNLSGLTAYAGPATLVWAGTLTVTATNLPVYRYIEPTRRDADKFAASLGATPGADVAQGGLGVYSGHNFTLVVLGSVSQPAREPYFNLSDLKSITTSVGGDPVAIATAYLAAHKLMPTWPYQSEVQTIGGATVRVRFLRSFDLQAQGQASLVDSVGDRYGTEVDLAPDTIGAFESGPLPLSLEAASYPIISADQAIRSLGASSAPAGSTSIPVVRVTKAELVYTLVWAGDHSFYEPAFQFSGTFTDHGVTNVKRVLIPAVDPAYLSH